MAPVRLALSFPPWTKVKSLQCGKQKGGSPKGAFDVRWFTEASFDFLRTDIFIRTVDEITLHLNPAVFIHVLGSSASASSFSSSSSAIHPDPEKYYDSSVPPSLSPSKLQPPVSSFSRMMGREVWKRQQLQ
ncbi:hypothetical protein OPV22_014276 [Ensete ventricosum]|uniref:Uncharacterized protein n=1 Tax=Ensete ventricosum TaxID=4639 RepID=A0AAV8R197_ENSVE|nr:hypothetical protein OPV22_014276 [Ensete ventricosum]